MMNEKKNKGMSKQEQELIHEIREHTLKISRWLIKQRSETEEERKKMLEKGLTPFEIATKMHIPIITMGEIKQDMGDCEDSRDYSNFLGVLRDRGIWIQDDWKYKLQLFGGYNDREVISNVPDELAFKIVKWEEID